MTHTSKEEKKSVGGRHSTQDRGQDRMIESSRSAYGMQKDLLKIKTQTNQPTRLLVYL